MEQQVEGYGTPQHLRQVTGANGHFAHQPIGPAGPVGVPVAAALSEIPAGDHAQSGGNYLHEDGHQAGQADHPQKSVLEVSAALQVRPPVTGVHVADADENRRPDESSPLLPKAGQMVRHLDVPCSSSNDGWPLCGASVPISLLLTLSLCITTH